MKLVRFLNGGNIVYGIVEGDRVRETGINIFKEPAPTDNTFLLSSIKIFPPCIPSKIVAVGLNYRAHARELNMAIPEEPLIFLKPSSAVIGHGDEIRYPAMSKRVDYEGELAVVIGKKCSHAPPEHAREYILGYTCFNDVTARDLQQKDGQFTRSKSFDTFASIGPYVETDLDPDNLTVETFLNGQKRQEGSTADFIFSVAHVVSFISQVMTLYPGDVIATGTPPGIGPMQIGDVVEVSIEGIGVLRNTVAADRF